MKLAIQSTLREIASLTDDQLLQLGLRGIEMPVWQYEASLTVGLKPCLFDSHLVLGSGDDYMDKVAWDTWFQAAQRHGAQGVCAAVQVEPDSVNKIFATVWQLSDLAQQRGSRLLLTVRSERDATILASYAPLIDWCAQRDGQGIGLILDVEAASLLGDEPRQLLREAQGYVQHVRVPSPAWRRTNERTVEGVLQELQRLSYIDYVALYGEDDPIVPMAEAIDALRQAAVRAWI